MVDVVDGDIDRPFEGTFSRSRGVLTVETHRISLLKGVDGLVIWTTEGMDSLGSLGLQSMRL